MDTSAPHSQIPSDDSLKSVSAGERFSHHQTPSDIMITSRSEPCTNKMQVDHTLDMDRSVDMLNTREIGSDEDQICYGMVSLKIY